MTLATTEQMMTKEQTPAYMTIEEAADLLRVSERTIYRLMDEDRLTRYKIGRSTRVRRSEVLAVPAEEDRSVLREIWQRRATTDTNNGYTVVLDSELCDRIRYVLKESEAEAGDG